MNGVGTARDADGDLLAPLDALIGDIFFRLYRQVQKNLAVLALAFLRLLLAGYGHLSLAAIPRMLPTAGCAHTHEKRLHRFLDNPRLNPRGVSVGLVQLIVGTRGKGLWPVMFDQTKAGSTQALLAGVPWAVRVLPVSDYTFDYPWQETAVMSQNQFESIFLTDLELSLPEGVTPVFVGDRV
jgi:hypothetical protein